MQSHKSESIKIVDEWLDNYHESDVEARWEDFNYSMFLSNVLQMNLEREAQFFHDTGVYGQDAPDIRNSIFTDYLEQVWPERVTIY